MEGQNGSKERQEKNKHHKKYCKVVHYKKILNYYWRVFIRKPE
jgi:hypothetical protein